MNPTSALNILSEAQQQSYVKLLDQKTKLKNLTRELDLHKKKRGLGVASLPVGQRKLIALILSAPAAPLLWSPMMDNDLGGYIFLSILFGCILVALGLWAAHSVKDSMLFALLDLGRVRHHRLSKQITKLTNDINVAEQVWINDVTDTLNEHNLDDRWRIAVVKDGQVWILDQKNEVILRPYEAPVDPTTTVIDDSGKVYTFSERTAAIINAAA